MATRKLKTAPIEIWPKINQGTHLTVTTYEDGKTELVWDWDALVNEVRTATETAESLPAANWPYPD
jgi:hypothetical protein